MHENFFSLSSYFQFVKSNERPFGRGKLQQRHTRTTTEKYLQNFHLPEGNKNGKNELFLQINI